MPKEVGDLAKNISKESTGATWSLLAPCSKMQEEREKLKQRFLDSRQCLRVLLVSQIKEIMVCLTNPD